VTAVTKTLVLAGDPQVTTHLIITRRDATGLRYLTGKEVGAVYMPAQQSGGIMTTW